MVSRKRKESIIQAVLGLLRTRHISFGGYITISHLFIFKKIFPSFQRMYICALCLLFTVFATGKGQELLTFF